jgi:hypothetical protein
MAIGTRLGQDFVVYTPGSTPVMRDRDKRIFLLEFFEDAFCLVNGRNAVENQLPFALGSLDKLVVSLLFGEAFISFKNFSCGLPL